MLRLKCSEIWGGIKNQDVDVCSPGMNVSLYSSSCDGGKGGDVYYFSQCSADRVTRIALADVLGHGEQVSPNSQWVYEQMAAGLDHPDLSSMVAELNRRVLAEQNRALTTADFLSYYVDLKELYYCYAGYPRVLFSRGSGAWTPFVPQHSARLANLPLGVTKSVQYDVGHVALARGDRMLLFSNGVLETPNHRGEHFGAQLLAHALTEVGAAEPVYIKTHLLNRLRAWTGGLLTHDDVTLIAIQLE